MIQTSYLRRDDADTVWLRRLMFTEYLTPAGLSHNIIQLLMYDVAALDNPDVSTSCQHRAMLARRIYYILCLQST